MNVLSRLISKGVEGNTIDPFRLGRDEITLSQLQFADDTCSVPREKSPSSLLIIWLLSLRSCLVWKLIEANAPSWILMWMLLSFRDGRGI